MLGVEMHTTINTLFSKGYNKSQISRILKIDRKTVRTVLNKLEQGENVERKERPTIIDPYKEYINIQVTKGLSAMRIFQDIASDGYEGSYDTVKRYVARVKKTPSKVYAVLESLPGEEAQVDFSYIGTLKLNGKRKKAWIFVMALSYSRYMYADIVFDQSVKTFIECHKRAFRYFTGVPHTVKLDNLKAGIMEANFYEPIIQRSYAAFAAHYGFLPEPCRVNTPTDKGKIEANVKYIKNNCFKGREFADIEEARAFLREWLNTIANTRVHGTTKKVPRVIFDTVEKEKLNPLPLEEFTFSEFQSATVMPNCHICFKSNYYSVPHVYIGQKVDVIAEDNLLKIYYHTKEIALHHLVRDDKGQRQTDKNHYPKQKNITATEAKSRYREQMAEIGKNALAFYDSFMQKQAEKYSYRSILGIISLRKAYDDALIDSACQRALAYGALRYKAVKSICEKSLGDLPSLDHTYLNTSETSLARPLAEYSRLLRGEV